MQEKVCCVVGCDKPGTEHVIIPLDYRWNAIKYTYVCIGHCIFPHVKEGEAEK
jgi:hypothetical protein